MQNLQKQTEFINFMFYIKIYSISLKTVKLNPEWVLYATTGRYIAFKNLSWKCSMAYWDNICLLSLSR